MDIIATMDDNTCSPAVHTVHTVHSSLREQQLSMSDWVHDVVGKEVMWGVRRAESCDAAGCKPAARSGDLRLGCAVAGAAGRVM
ncbi:MAG: hypothetical protein ACOX9E_11795 [Lentisphaeria bacterium]